VALSTTLEACKSALVPCSPECPGDRSLPEGDSRRWNGQAWSLALRGAQRDRAERIATNTRRNGYSVEFLAREAGLVPHGTTSSDPACEKAQTIQRNAAAVCGFEYRRSPWRQTPSFYHLTAWATAR